MNEADIIKGCVKSKPKAQRKLFEQYAPTLRSVAMRYLKNRNDAEDIIQDSFITILTKIRSYSGNGSFEGWMKRIVVNNCLLFIRKKNKEIMQELKEENLHEEASDNNDENLSIKGFDFTKDELHNAVDSLPDGYRIVFNMYAVEGFKHKEISNFLGVTESTSKSQLARARKLLRDELIKKKELAI
jgi:RNA polymerase sigma-70 factor (ECF subfamily)